MAKYPIYLDLTDTVAVVVGAGSVAARKVKTLLGAGARVRVITRTIEKDFEESCKGLDIEILMSEYSKSHLADAFLVIAATDDHSLNTQVYNDCKALKILCNVVDVPELCNFYVPSIIRQGDLQVAISTNGKCPAYAAHLKRMFQKLITEDHARFLDCLDFIRKGIIASGIPITDRKTLLVRLSDDASFELFLKQGPDIWKKMALDLLSANRNKD
jgi:precorrin-2 dehydrogenase/sirohydrochlorin ferrochelatase